MFEMMASVALLVSLSASPAASESWVAMGIRSGGTVTTPSALQSVPERRDPLKNGAVIGAIAGGLTGAALWGLGCAATSGLGTEEDTCTGAMLVGGAVGAGLGAVIGLGIDAMFEQAPYPGIGASGRRAGLRVRIGF